MRRCLKMDRVWNYLAKNGPLPAYAVAEVFYPKLSAIGQANGGPSRGTTCALWLLGRMRRRGLVEKHCPDEGPSLWRVVR